MNIQTARTIVSNGSKALLAGDVASVFQLLEAAELADAYHVARVAAGHKAARARRVKATRALRTERRRHASRVQAGIRAALTRDLRRQILTST